MLQLQESLEPGVNRIRDESRTASSPDACVSVVGGLILELMADRIPFPSVC
jgi:hypothetical protein